MRHLTVLGKRFTHNDHKRLEKVYGQQNAFEAFVWEQSRRVSFESTHGFRPHRRHLPDELRFMREPRRVARAHTPHPKDLTGKVVVREHVASGGFAEVSVGSLDGHTVAVKVLRHFMDDSEADRQRKFEKLRHEVSIWHRLGHTNVVEFLGVATDTGPYVAMVSPWMCEGDLTRYITRFNLCLKERWNMIDDVAAGLDYLHARNVVHGDLTGSNVLVDMRGRCLLSDFGLSKLHDAVLESPYTANTVDSLVPYCAPDIDNAVAPSGGSNTLAGSVRWAAPEVTIPGEDSPKGSRVSVASDMFSFGRIIYHILTRLIPFHELGDFQVVLALYHGDYPSRTADIADDEWEALIALWNPLPDARPDMRRCRAVINAKRRSFQKDGMPAWERGLQKMLSY